MKQKNNVNKEQTYKSELFLWYNEIGDNMVIPRFKEDFTNKNLKELLQERQTVLKEIIRIEKESFFQHKILDEFGMLRHPTPEVIWSVLNDDLIMLTELIKEKSRNEEGFVEVIID